MLQTRNWNIDLAKAIAMLLVVLQHAWSMLGLDDPAFGLVCGGYRAISTVGVPLFVFVSGALLLPRQPEPLKVFYKKRLNRLLVPFLLFASLMYIVSLFTGQYDWWSGDLKTAVLRFAPSLLENKINILHWFVHMLLVIYLLTPFLQHAVQGLSRRELEGILFVWALGMLFRQYYPTLNVLAYTTTLWKYLGVYVAGYYVTQYRVGEKRYFYLGLVATVLLILLDSLTDCAVHLGVPFTAIAMGLVCLNLSAVYPPPISVLHRACSCKFQPLQLHYLLASCPADSGNLFCSRIAFYRYDYRVDSADNHAFNNACFLFGVYAV